jgi:hypothetical protein
MSDTPRTDALYFDVNILGDDKVLLMYELASQLERELAQVHAKDDAEHRVLPTAGEWPDSDYFIFKLRQRAGSYANGKPYHYSSGDAAMDRNAANLLEINDANNTSQRELAIEECARLVDDFDQQGEYGDEMVMLAAAIRDLKASPTAAIDEEGK